jgi:RNA polymerase sigma-70 factor (ECF subfamily)
MCELMEQGAYDHQARFSAVQGGTSAEREPASVADGEEAGPRSDDELVAMARFGDTKAFGELIQRHHSACLKRALLMMRNRGDAEDEVQNACWKALQSLDQYRGEGTFAAWLGRIVENQCLMRIRQERSACFIHLDESAEGNMRIELVGQTEGPEDQLGCAEVVSLLRREASRMPPLLRNVMQLRDLDQLSMPDVAARLGLSVPAAKSRLMRARAELRMRIVRHCGRKGHGTLMQKAKYDLRAYARVR